MNGIGSQICRVCAAPLELTLVDLGMSPLCESFVPADQLDAMEPFYPLHVRICTQCWLGQLGSFVPPEEIFTDYGYFSSYSSSWVEHAHTYVETMRERLGLGEDTLVVELASNDGYLLQHFVGTGIPILGIEPAANVAEAAIEKGVPTEVTFFGRETATGIVARAGRASLIAANNVFAQVPDLDDFIGGIELLLAPGGTLTVEVPHLLRLIEGIQYDTIYHEHFSYFSLVSLDVGLRQHGLEVVDVEELSTHGGSLRIYARHEGESAPSAAVARVLSEEEQAGLHVPEGYRRFAERVADTRQRLLELLIDLRREGSQVAGYGAPGKGNTLLNYCGIRSDLLAYTVDRNPHKQGMFLPGTHIPIHHPDRLAETTPDHVLVLPWNLLGEIKEQLRYVESWGGKLLVPVPEPRVVDW